ncbi:MAG: hypothetical protein OXN17_13305 [Candidatus Poribacteria bacterium]|nr:hypothetical protein [Candidatus Poribacteria bacterium]MDE0504101.1 hypothetical protein [Candidatus Poribacteria bacterium]
MMKTNICVLMAMLLSTQMIIGCSGRRGPFIELGVGAAPVVSDEEWTLRRHENSLSRVVIDHHDTIATAVSPAGNLKIGWGLSEQFLVSLSSQISKLGTFGPGITVFQKKTAPSLFFDVVYNGLSTNKTNRLPVEFPNSDATGDGVSVGVGYEFKRNWTVKGDFSYGTHRIDHDDIGGWEDFLGQLFAGSVYPHNSIEGKTTVYSLGFKINYFLY